MHEIFGDANSGRKHLCFVCGLPFETLEEYRKHIIENHELGRDFVSCPLCEYPVRDLRAHAKAKHPYRQLPKNCQMRATVWRDFANKRKQTMKFKEGYFESAKNHGKKMHYRSSYELDTYKALEQFEQVIAYDVEKIKIPYLFEGTQHTYYPDLIVQFSDGHTEVWEIKPLSQTSSVPKNEAKWQYCNEWCHNRNFIFKVITERAIGMLKKGIMV